MEIRTGNIHAEIAEHPENRGWIIGNFISQESPLFSEDIQVKWVEHAAGEIRNGSTSELSQKSIDILLEGQGKFIFPSHNLEYILQRGDYVVYDTSICTHIFEAISDTKLIVIRSNGKKSI